MHDYCDDQNSHNSNWFPFAIIIIIALAIIIGFCYLHSKPKNTKVLGWKDFLVQYPEYELSIDGKKVNKYDSLNLGFMSYTLISISKHDQLKEVGIKNNQTIKFDLPLFGLIDQIQQTDPFNLDFTIMIQVPKQSNSAGDIYMTIEQILLTILISLIVAKFAYKISWKTLFRPMKKGAAHLKKEWEDS